MDPRIDCRPWTILEASRGSQAAMRNVKLYEEELADLFGWAIRPGVDEALGRQFHRLAKLGAARALGKFGKSNDRLAILMGIDHMVKVAPWMIAGGGTKAIVLFDAWPSSHDLILDNAARYGLGTVFVTSSQAAARLSERNQSCRWLWLPEALPRDEYSPAPLSGKTIDVMQFGRKHDAYHDAIVDKCAREGLGYFYEKRKGEVVFQSPQEFLQRLGESAVSVCFPQSWTHPERAGDIETMTLRYLQSMASKCVLVGHAPQEMIEVFGYNPVVEADMSDPFGQLREILGSLERYEPLVESNYAAVMRGHTWRTRAVDLRDILNGSKSQYEPVGTSEIARKVRVL